MEVNLTGRRLEGPRLPTGYTLLPWDPLLLDLHAEAKYHSFRFEVDSNVFPCLGEYDGCLRLMKEIAGKETFLPQATWLAVYDPGDGGPLEYCGTIQGIRDKSGFGAEQNIGTTPEHRGQGLGTALIVRSLAGFLRSGQRRVYLEVTAQNHGAVRLYRRLGFAKVRTVYKAVEMATV